MAKSGRSPPAARPRKGSGSGRAPAPAPPSPAPAPAAPAATARLVRAGKARDPGRPDHAPSLQVDRPAPLARLWQWLLEDPTARRRRARSEREKALAELSRAAPHAAPAAPPRGLKQRLASFFDSGEILTYGAAGAATAPKPAKPPGRVARLVHQVLGEKRHVDERGDTIIVPPPRNDWRWHAQRLLRSNVRGIAYLRSVLVVVLLLGTAWTAVYANTGFDLTDLAFTATDPDDPVTAHKLPFYIVESGSMMHPDSPFGRLGTVDPGDLVIIEKVSGRTDIQTFYGKGDRHVAGAKGDVIVFIPIIPNLENPPPVIHRPMAYLELTSVPIPNPRYGEPGQPAVVSASRYTVAEFGIVNAASVTIPELGLVNYAPTMGGFLTRGDNPRSNTWSDQALGVTPYPVPADRIIGRLKAEVPVIGLAKIMLTGQDPSLISADDDWCTFLAGQAACDTWAVFLVGVALFVGVPLVIAVFVYGRRAWRRHLETLALQRWQDEEAARLSALRRGHSDDAAAPALPIHDATDLLSGKVRVRTGPAPGRTADWHALTGPARVTFDDGDQA